MSWQRKPRVPLVVREWTQTEETISTEAVISKYESGFSGTLYDPEEREQLFTGMAMPDGEVVATRFFQESGKGKLSVPYTLVQNHYDCWPTIGQQTGDCVSRAGKNAGLVLLGVESALKEPDSTTGIIEAFPEVSEIGRKNGVLASEGLYGDRGHKSAGASCSRLIRHATEWGGMLLRRNYTAEELNQNREPDVEEYLNGIDLERLDTKLAIAWGSKQTPEGLRRIGQDHQIRLATNVNGHEVGRDFVHNGYPLWACSGLGWSKTRDENGFSKRSGSWSHSWIIAGYDDRPEIVKMYGHALALFIHDWGKWNRGGRRIYGTTLEIPEGAMWIDARLLDKCDVWAMSSLAGWKAQTLPDYNPGW